MQLITKLITPARSVPKFPILSKDGSFSSLLLFLLLLTYRYFVIKFFFRVQRKKKKKKKIIRIEALENLLDLLFPITCVDFFNFFPNFLPLLSTSILRRRRSTTKKDDR